MIPTDKGSVTMFDFQRPQLSQKDDYERILFACPPRGCEYSFANLYLWGRQQLVFTRGCVAFFSHFNGRSVYPYPIGDGDKRAVIEEILLDAKQRGIPCRIVSMTQADQAELQGWFPDRFLYRTDRDGFDYVYSVDDLADLKGRKFQKKRNHVNRFRAEHPRFELQTLTHDNFSAAQHMVSDWYRARMQADPAGDYMLESIALSRAFRHYEGLKMEGAVLLEDGEILALTMGSRLWSDTFDIHFEKAREDVEGAYAAINCEFARYLRLKYPELRYLNREDDVGLAGLRKAKLSYNPHHMTEKFWAYLAEDFHGD
ncbi:MAG: DUF2156 domain-containing protein [Clostridiales bacterium]|nr:DUF2156 domain-containing protein [Clostridiales bacterium]